MWPSPTSSARASGASVMSGVASTISTKRLKPAMAFWKVSVKLRMFSMGVVSIEM